MRKHLVITSLLLLSLAGLNACRDHDSDNGVLSQQENDDRVGRETVRCGVPQVGQEVVEAIQDAANLARSARIKTARSPGTVAVPVIFHVIASGASPEQGAVSDEQLASQIDVMNVAYAGGYGGSNTAFRFYAAGVNRIIDPSFASFDIDSEEERIVKESLRVGDATTLNVYVAAPLGGLLGFATFPWSYESDPLKDGVVISFETLPGGSFAPYNEGVTLVHEVGHWLGLLHTFQDSCSEVNDTISDTPPEAGPAYGCPTGRDTCFGDSIDPVQNYMDYGDDFCLLEFTPEQTERVDLLSQIYRGL